MRACLGAPVQQSRSAPLTRRRRPLRLTLITTTRKFFTVFISVFLFGHVLTLSQWLAVALVLGGVALELVEKLSDSSSHAASAADAAPVKLKTK
jgi:UDP-galactose transporter B1